MFTSVILYRGLFCSQARNAALGKIRAVSFVEILVIILLGVMSGAETWIDIEDYGKQKEEWLRTFLELPNGIPSNDTYRRLMERICTKRVENMYRAWVLPYVGVSSDVIS